MAGARVHPLIGGGPHRPRVGGTRDWMLQVNSLWRMLPTDPASVEAMIGCYARCKASSFQSLVPLARGRWRPLP